MKPLAWAALALTGAITAGCSLVRQPSQADAIRQNRMGTLVITAAPGAAVHV